MNSPVRESIKILNKGDLAYKLPSSYKIDDTIISKILEVIEEEINEFRQACYGVEDVHNMDNKNGVNLDNYAKNFEIKRNGYNDGEFRKIIQVILNARGSYGDNDTIIKNLADYFNLQYPDFWTEIIDTRKLKIFIPGTVSEIEAFNMIKKIKAAGIRLKVEFYLEYEQNDFYNGTIEVSYIDDVEFIGCNIV